MPRDQHERDDLPVDPEEAELERWQREAARDAGEHGEWRAEFGREVGRTTHRELQDQLRDADVRRGRVEGRDFAIEHRLPDPDGGEVRLDYVDLTSHHIVEIKPRAGEDDDEAFAARHAEQQARYERAYEAAYGVRPTFAFHEYPSSRDTLARLREEECDGF